MIHPSRIRIVAVLLSASFATVSLTKMTYSDGFDWGSGDDGSGTFQQQIAKNAAVEVGEIPSGLSNVEIFLISDRDVDIQLIDKATRQYIVAWPNGVLNGPGHQTTTLDGFEIEYSGYDGDGTGTGHEYIKINGTTDRVLTMRAFGYAAGSARVNYSWRGGDGGSGTFQQQIAENTLVEVGEIPTGLGNVEIYLVSDEDVDIQLIDKATGLRIVAWPNGELNGSEHQTTRWHEVEIEYSGYDGDGTGPGHEYIKIHGRTDRALIMRVFGYTAGFATVNYSWGSGNAGSGTFQQQIAEDTLVEVGEIPTGLTNVHIQLVSDEDVDIQLIDQATGQEIVAWPNGELNGPERQTTTWGEVEIEYSGFDGDGTGPGHEYIVIRGKTDRTLIMKAYGYAAGFATIDYSWGGPE